MAALDAVVLDMGGVVLDWDPRHLYRRILDGDGAAVESFLSGVCTPEWHLQHDRGRSMQETVPELCREHPDQAHLIVAWRDRYMEMVAGLVPGIVEVMTELRAAGVALYGLTNMPAEIYPKVRRAFPVLDLLSGIVVSGEEGRIKPDPELFLCLLQRYGLDPRCTLLVDDTAENLETARQLGFAVHHFCSSDRLREDLVRVGLLDGPG